MLFFAVKLYNMSLFCCKKRNICLGRKWFWVNSNDQLYERPLQSCWYTSMLAFKIVIQRVKSFKKWFWSWMEILWIYGFSFVICRKVPTYSDHHLYPDLLFSVSVFWAAREPKSSEGPKQKCREPCKRKWRTQ